MSITQDEINDRLQNVSRSDMSQMKFSRAFERIKDLGREMMRQFDVLTEAQEELRALGIQTELELPQPVLTALSVHRREEERLAAERERSFVR